MHNWRDEPLNALCIQAAVLSPAYMSIPLTSCCWSASHETHTNCCRINAETHTSCCRINAHVCKQAWAHIKC